MIEIDYTNLVKDYYENLNSNLRHFKGGPDFLETWAHDEDHTRSIQEILHLAVDHGVNELSLQLGSDVMTKINCQKLETHFQDPWVIQFQNDILLFGKKKKSISSAEEVLIPVPYRRALVQRASGLQFLNKWNYSGSRVISAGSPGSLTLGLDSKDNILAAKHSGFTGTSAVVMDAFCEVIIGLPLQEAADHGVLRLEQSLREGAIPYSKGLVLPEKQLPFFKNALDLIRELYAESGAEPKRNTYRDPVAADWLKLEPSEQLQKGRDYLKHAIESSGLQPEVDLVEIRNSTRFVLSYVQKPNFPDFGNAMIKLEFELQKKSGLPIELQLETTEDRNKRTQRTKRA